ncbi:hypothetical protein [Thermospira aquatica]|uniref:Uncharacterized protein n=1 Tax=Thermospira aquatica TaxID=2828656 RepID=A0AAX3BCM3_9SPIR|nr:hypothetical protein [Thermospira aquatica]URA09896.1 hypothetical protein KDW03_10490 [Thermospira aquatica]
MGVNIFASGISSGTGALGGAVQGMISGMGGAVAGAVEAVAGAGIQGLGNLAVSGLKVNEYGGLDWRMDSVQLATWGVSTIGSMVLAGVNSGYNPSTATTWEAAGYAGMNWAINSTVSFINKGWKMDESGRLYWGLTNEGEVTEAWMDLGIGTLKSGLSFVFEGNYTGYGAKQKESLLAYALSKGMDIYKYNLYQQGVFGKELQDKYAGQNAFDLAGGLDLTVLQTTAGVASLKILSRGLELHSGAGEFGGFGFTMDKDGSLWWNGFTTWQNTMENFREIGDAIYREREESNMVIIDLKGEENTGAPRSDQITNWLKRRDIYFFGLKVGNRKEYYNQKAPNLDAEWDIIYNPNSSFTEKTNAMRKIMEGFKQDVTEGEDATDKIQRAIDSILKDVKNGKFAMGIEGKDARELKKILESGDEKKFKEFGDRIVKEKTSNSNQKQGETSKKDESQYSAVNYRVYLNALKYIYDNKETAAAYIQSEACAIIGFYLLSAFTGNLDGRKVSFSDFFRIQLENGLIGKPTRDGYKTWPVFVQGFKWKGKEAFLSKLNANGSVEGVDIFIRITPPDLVGKNRSFEIICDGRTVEEVSNRLAEVSQRFAELKALTNKTSQQKREMDSLEELVRQYGAIINDVNGFSAALSGLYNSTATFYLVQRKRNFNDTHFFIMMKQGNDYYIVSRKLCLVIG